MGEISETVLGSHNIEDFKCAFRDLQRAAHDTALAKGWWNPPKTFGEQLLLFHSEISEALEEHRVGHQPDEIYYNEQYGVPTKKPEGIPIEFADLLIRLFDTCEHYNIDLLEAVLLKM